MPRFDSSPLRSLLLDGPVSVAAAAREALKVVARQAGIDRARVATNRLYFERHLLALTSRPRERSCGRILCYHSVGQPRMGVNDVTPKQFRRHIELALSLGYKFVPPSKLANGEGTAKDLAITFDDGLISVKEQAAPILKEFGIPWSLFVVSEWSEQTQPWTKGFVLDWTELQDLMADDVEIGSHSATHPDFGRLEPSQMLDELSGSRDLIEKRLGFVPKAFAIPYGQSKNWPQAAADLAKAAGYDHVYAQAEETRAPGTIARTFVTRADHDTTFKALLGGAYACWEEWY